MGLATASPSLIKRALIFCGSLTHSCRLSRPYSYPSSDAWDRASDAEEEEDEQEGQSVVSKPARQLNTPRDLTTHDTLTYLLPSHFYLSIN